MIQEIASHKAFDGKVSYYKHISKTCDTEMKFSVYDPPSIKSEKVPILFYLAGLTCTEETFMIKSGALNEASKLGLLLVSPDTSPRNSINGEETKDWDFGTGAGFYLDATEQPWDRNYKMFSYVTEELTKIVHENFNCNPEKQSIFGHSMGGHGALVCALKRPDLYKSVSCFAPISSPINSPWGKKAFSGYLGKNQTAWKEWDSSYLIEKNYNSFDEILIDQGTNDEFLEEELKPNIFFDKCMLVGQKLIMRYQDNYDHGYNFISTFINDHLSFHSQRLK